MARQNKWESKHQKDLERYARQIDAIYQEAVREAAAIGATIPNFSPDKPFSFADYPNTQKRVQKLIDELKNNIQTVILNGVDSEWTLANNKNNELCNVVFGKNVKKLTTEQERRYYRSNGKACDAFKTRKTAGLGLSDRVWNYTNQFKSEIEMGIDLGLRDGLSADEMSRDLRQYLKYPDKLFRRVRDEHGQLHLSKAAKAFNPGQGVYRSSYKNAMRLARTETNMAYRTSDYTRWQQLDFVVGIEVHTSNNHPIADICDELAGKYPKDFKFVGWHPQCRCHAVSILKTDEEMAADNERIMNDEPLTGESVNRIDDVPQQFKQWTANNEKRLTTAKSMPYFVRDNEKYFPQMRITDAAAKGVKESQAFNGLFEKLSAPIEKPLSIKERAAIRHAARTPEQEQAIQKAWDANRKKTHRQATLTAAKARQAARTPKQINAIKIKWNNNRVAQKTGVKQGKSMSFKKADEGHTNPHYENTNAYNEGYYHNCQTCTVSYEARRRGLPVEARPNKNDSFQKWCIDNDFDWQDRFMNINGTRPGYSLSRINVTDTSMSKISFIERTTQQQGRYEVYAAWKRGDAHVFCVERLTNGNLRWFDPQSGRYGTSNDFIDYVINMRENMIGVMRIDDKLINPKFAEFLIKSKPLSQS